MGLSLPHGGHLTHGWNVSFSGSLYRAVQYEIDPATSRIDMDQVRDLALEHRPKLLIAGATAYPRTLDFSAFSAIAREVGAFFLADMAHIAGLVAGGAHPSPVPHADVVTTTTHKSLRGPRGALILTGKKHYKAIQRAVFPGLQGGPHNHTTAAMAVALHEAAQPEFSDYHQVVANAKALAARLLERGLDLVTGGTDNHLLLVDLTRRGLGGKPIAQALDRAGIVCNYNSVPHDTRPPMDPSGIRLGTPAVTTRGMAEAEMAWIADRIADVVEGHEDEPLLDRMAKEVRERCHAFSAPGVGI